MLLFHEFKRVLKQNSYIRVKIWYGLIRDVLRRIRVNSRKLVNMILKTALVGTVVGLIMSFIVEWGVYKEFLSPFDGMELLGVFIYFLGFALTFTVVSMAGFLAYLFVHQFGSSILRAFWPLAQILIVAFALFDIVYFSNNDIPVMQRIYIALFVLIAALIVSYIKTKQTNFTSWFPAMFFMVVITALELTLGLRTNDMQYIVIILVTLVVANAYQLIEWHNVTKIDPEHQKRIEARRKARLERKKAQLKEEAKVKKNNKAEKNSKKK